MKNSLQKFVFVFFITLVAVQWYVPARMIYNKEHVLTSGKSFKFKMQPIDPQDPFRGDYIVLRLEPDTFEMEDHGDWERGQLVFVEIGEDESGYTTIKGLTEDEPTNTEDYAKGMVEWVEGEHPAVIHIRFPFNRFYMEEKTALNAENAIREATRDSSQVSYALVHVKNGDAVVSDVFINDLSIKEILEKQKADKN